MPELQQLYSCLELEFIPLQLSKRVTPILESLEEDEILKQYIEPARDVMLVRLIKEVGKNPSCSSVVRLGFVCFSGLLGVPGVRDGETGLAG